MNDFSSQMTRKGDFAHCEVSIVHKSYHNKIFYPFKKSNLFKNHDTRAFQLHLGEKNAINFKTCFYIKDRCFV